MWSTHHDLTFGDLVNSLFDSVLENASFHSIIDKYVAIAAQMFRESLIYIFTGIFS